MLNESKTTQIPITTLSPVLQILLPCIGWKATAWTVEAETNILISQVSQTIFALDFWTLNFEI